MAQKNWKNAIIVGFKNWKTAMTTTTRTVEKGIRELTYLNKDGSSVVKYQVRIHTKELPNFNVLVESLDVAREIVANAKSSAGRELIKSLKIKANEPKKKTKEEKHQALLNSFNHLDDGKVLAEVLKDESLNVMFDYWFNQHIKKPETNEVDKKNNNTYQLLIKSICNTYVVDWYRQNKIIENTPINLRSMISEPRRIKIGDISIFELTSRTWLEYINSRLEQGKAKSTVAREISAVSSMYNKLYLMGSRYKSIENPIDKEVKNKVKIKFQKRETRIDEDVEQQLIKALSESRNPNMLYIFQLALFTGARRSEVLFWKWENLKLDDNYYFQEKTKNDQSRKIPLNSQAKEVLAKIKKIDGQARLFNYTIDGFKTNWQRAREKAGLKNIQFRDTRNEYISRGMENTDNPVITAKLAGINNQAYFNQTHLKPHLVNQNLKGQSNNASDIQRAVGHLTEQMTNHYTRLDYSKIDEITKPISKVNQGDVSNNDDSFRLEELKLKVKFNKATPEEREELLMMMLEGDNERN